MTELRRRLDAKVRLAVKSAGVGDEVHVLVQGRPTAEQLAGLPALRALIIPYAGVPAETRQLLLDLRPDLPVYNLHHNAPAAAELAMALFLAAAKSILPTDRAFRTHDWRSRYDGEHVLLLEGRTAVVLGYGEIGRRIARACDALGMSVCAVRRRSVSSDTREARIHNADELQRLLPTASALFIAVPLTPETEGMIGRTELGQLASDCILVNIARGPIVDEDALYTALRDGKIGGAGIDVWYAYPKSPERRSATPPSRHPFHKLDNVVMSPHRGGAFRVSDLEHQRMNELARTINALARGTPPPHRVDVRAGY